MRELYHGCVTQTRTYTHTHTNLHSVKVAFCVEATGEGTGDEGLEDIA